jgi:FAD/FMN-containing dehydrogenase
VVDLPSFRSTELSGWGSYPVEECDLYQPRNLEELREIIQNAPQADLISRGKGRSYGDAALNQNRGVLLPEGQNRILQFQEDSGVIECEASTSISEILDHVLPRGFFLPITPGTKHITIGGAIAADIHGKNHHRDGTISTQLLDFRLVTGTGTILSCSRTQNADLFWATLGGMGLTGVLLDARLQLRRMETAYVSAYTERCQNLDETLERMETGDRHYDYAVAWIDCLARGRALGRSVLLRANPASLDDLPTRLRASPNANPRLPTLEMPFELPSFLLNPFNMRLFNAAFFRAPRARRSLRHCNRYFYPLDRIDHWNRIYGRRGVLQYQLVLPCTTARQGLREILDQTTASGRGSFLAVLKSTGPATVSPLSFPIEGISLALDFPNTGSDLLDMLGRLDSIVVRHGGRVYLAKDSCLGPEDFRAMYPRLAEFQAVKKKYDPKTRFSSSLARRLGIVENP